MIFRNCALHHSYYEGSNRLTAYPSLNEVGTDPIKGVSFFLFSFFFFAECQQCRYEDVSSKWMDCLLGGLRVQRALRTQCINGKAASARCMQPISSQRLSSQNRIQTELPCNP